MPTIEDRRDELIREGTYFRKDIVSLFEEVRKFRVGFANSVLRGPLKTLEEKYDSLLSKFVEYDERISTLLVEMGTAKQIIPQQGGNPEPISLNTQFAFAIYGSQLSSQREAVRSLLEHLGSALSNHRAQANNLTTTAIALTSLVVAAIYLAIAIIGAVR